MSTRIGPGLALRLVEPSRIDKRTMRVACQGQRLPGAKADEIDVRKIGRAQSIARSVASPRLYTYQKRGIYTCEAGRWLVLISLTLCSYPGTSKTCNRSTLKIIAGQVPDDIDDASTALPVSLLPPLCSILSLTYRRSATQAHPLKQEHQGEMLTIKPLIAVLAALATGVAARPSYIAPDSNALGRRQEPVVSPAVSPAGSPAGGAVQSPGAGGTGGAGGAPVSPAVPAPLPDPAAHSPGLVGQSPVVPGAPVTPAGTPVQSPAAGESPMAPISPAVPNASPAVPGTQPVQGATGGVDNLTSLPPPPPDLPQIEHEQGTEKRFVAYWSATHGMFQSAVNSRGRCY